MFSFKKQYDIRLPARQYFYDPQFGGSKVIGTLADLVGGTDSNNLKFVEQNLWIFSCLFYIMVSFD